MQSLQKQFHDFILTNDLVKKDEKVLLAVSGGLDSMVMANLFLEENIPFAIAHCNFGLRGEESDGDEAFVMDWADKYNISCHVKAFEIGGGSIQLEARNARYQWFGELLSENRYDKVATAHHLNDSLETVLINLARGTGVKGMAGISVKNGDVIRPLLFAEREKIYNYAMQHDLEWREDSSNTKTDYDRNLIRHNVVPELLKLNPSLLKSIELTTERLAFASQIIAQKVDKIKDQYLADEKGGFNLDLNWLKKPSDELVLAEILASFGVNYVTAKEIFEARGKSGKSFPTEDWLITMDRNALFINRDGPVIIKETRIESPGVYDLEVGRVIVEMISKEEVVFGASNVAHFDASRLKFPLLIRSWKKGDKFQPLGMRGEKKVSDYLIDEKVPLAAKKSVMILETDQRIAWLIGLRMSEMFKIQDDSAEIVKVTFIGADA